MVTANPLGRGYSDRRCEAPRRGTTTLNGALDASLRALFQRWTVREGDSTAGDRDPIRILKILHRARHRLAARADHLRDRLMRERLLDGVAAGLLGEGDQQARNASGPVKQPQPADLLVRATQAARQLRQKRPRHRRRRFDALSKILTAQHEQM